MTASGTGPLRTAWRTLLATPERILVPTAVLSIPAFVLNVGLQVLISNQVTGITRCYRSYLGHPLVTECGPSAGRARLGTLLGLFVLLLLGHLVVAGINRAVLDAVDGLPVRGPFAGWDVLRVLPAAVLVSALLTLTTATSPLLALVVAFLTRYTVLVLVDRPSGTVAAIATSLRLVVARPVSEVVFALCSTAVLVAGALALGVGLYAAVPLVLLAQAIRYRAARPLAVPVG